MSPAGQQVSRLLSELLTVNRKMEFLLEKVEKNTSKEDGAGGAEMQTTAVSASQDMMSYLKSLDDKAAKTNQLLEQLIGKFDGVASGENVDATGGESLSGIGKGLSSIIKSAFLFSAVPPITRKSYIEFIRELILAVAGKDANGKDMLTSDEMDSLGALLGGVAGVINKFTENVVSTTLKLQLALKLDLPEKIGTLINRIVDSVSIGKSEKDTSDKIKAVSDVLTLLDKITITLPLKLMLAAPLWIGAAVAMVPMMLVVGSLQMFFNWIGSKTTADNVENGTTAIKGIGMGLAVLGIALLGFGAVVSYLGPGQLLMAVSVLAATSLAFVLVGKVAPDIDKGTEAVGAIGISLAVLGLGIYGMVFFLKKTGDLLGEKGSNILIAAGVAVGIVAVAGLAYYFVGKFATNIALGALAVGAIALSLGVLGWGMNTFFSNIAGIIGMGKENGFMAVAKGAAVVIGALVGFGLAYFFIGQAALAIAAGALAVAGIGLSLAVFGFGLKKTMEFTEGTDYDRLTDLGLAIGGLAIEFALIGNPITLIPLYAGIGAVTAMGIALWSVAKGIRYFYQTTLDIPFGDVEDTSTLLGRIKQSTVGIASAFAAVGSAGGERSGGLLGLLTGIKLGPNMVETGILSVLRAGDALISVSKGLKIFQGNINGIKSVDGTPGIGVFNPDDPTMSTGLIGDIYNAVSMVSKAFGAIGQSGNTGTSLTKILFGNDFKKSDTEVGIDSVLNAGKALSSVAEGLLKFQDTTAKFAGQQDAFVLNITTDGSGVRTAEGNGLLAKIFNTISAVHQVFGAIGAEDEGTSYLKILTGTDFGSTPTEKGIASVRDLGKVLSGVSEGIIAFAQVSGEGIPIINGYDKNGKPIFDKTKKITLQQVVDGIRKVFSDTEGILVPFKELGMQEDFTSGFLGMGGGDPKGPIGKGVKALQGIGPTLSGVVGILKLFTEKNAPDVNKANAAISGIFNAILNVVQGEDKKDLFESFSDVFNDKDVVESFRNFTKLTQGLVSLSGQAGGGITKVYTEVNSAVNMVGTNQNFTKFAAVIKSLAGVATPFEKFTKSFTKFSQDMGVFKTNFSVMNKDGIMAFKQWSDSIVNVSKVEVANSKGIVGFINDTVSAAFGGGRDASMGNKPAQEFTGAEKAKAVQNTVAPPPPAPAKTAEAKGPTIDTAAITAAITAALQNLTVQHITVTGDIVER